MKNKLHSMTQSVNMNLFWPGLFLILAFLGSMIIFKSPRVLIPGCIEIAPGKDPIIIGYKELGQRQGPLSADSDHIKIEKINNIWMFANISPTKRVQYKTKNHKSRFAKRWQLQMGDQIILDNQTIQVTQMNEAGYLSLLHVQTNRTATWKNGVLQVSDPFLYSQARSLRWRIQKRLRWWMASFISDYWENEMKLFSLGGGVNTPDRWQIQGLPPLFAHIGWYQNHFYLMPGKETHLIQMAHQPYQSHDHFSQIKWPLNPPNDPVQQLIIGKTYYKVKCTDSLIQLIPIRNTDAWFDHENPIQSMDRIQITYKPDNFIGACALSAIDLFKYSIYRLIMLLFVCLFLWVLIYKNCPFSKRFHLSVMIVPSVLFAGIAIICWPAHHSINLAYGLLFVWLSWIWSTYWLWNNGQLKGNTQFIWACGIILAGIGSLTLSQLAIGADNIKWLDYPRKHILVLSMFGWFFPVVRLLITSRVIGQIVIRNELRYKVVRYALGGAIVSILIYHFFKGSEQGLGVFQPSELAKFLFIIVGALTGMHLSELRYYGAEYLYNHPVKVVWSFMTTFIFVLCLALFVFLSVRDMSPLIISFLFILCWIWTIAPHPDSDMQHKTLTELICRGMVLCICMILIVGTIIIYNAPENLPTQMPQKDRFLVWSNPDMYPHSGEQVIKSMIFSGLGKWLGANDSWFGYNHAIMSVPMIQNDFIGAFMIYRWGGLFAILVLFAQMAYIQALLKTIHYYFIPDENDGYEIRRMKYIYRLIIYGFVWMTAIQWFIAWSNVLGLFPVMGQPMTWISQANSHLIFFALPSLAFAMIVSPNDPYGYA